MKLKRAQTPLQTNTAGSDEPHKTLELLAVVRMQINLHIVWHRLEKRPRTLSDAEPSSAKTAKTVKDNQRQYSTLGSCCRSGTTLGRVGDNTNAAQNESAYLRVKYHVRFWHKTDIAAYSAWRGLPRTSPVFGFTRWTCLHARQVTALGV